jgi:hypothetical protein
MNQAPATLEAETEIRAIPPVPSNAPLAIPPKPDYDPETEKTKLFDRVRKIRTSTTEKLREKTEEWKKQADAAEVAEAERAPKPVERTKEDEGKSDVELRYKRLMERLAEKAIGSIEERDERRDARRQASHQFKRAKGFTKQNTFKYLVMTGTAWFFSGGFLVAAYDRFIVATDIAAKMPGMPRATYLTGGGTPHTWDFFTGVPYQMREYLQAAMEAGSVGHWIGALIVLGLSVATAEYWRSLISTRWLLWALRVPLVGYLSGFLTFLIELGAPGGTL